MPTTPSWNSGSKRASAGGGSPSRHQVFERGLGLFAHAGFDFAPFTVDRIELLREVGSARRVVGDEALDAERHVGQAAGGVDARAEREAEVEGRCARGLALGHGVERGHTGGHAAGADALDALGDEAAIVAVELDDIGHGTEGNQVEQRVELGLCNGPPRALCTRPTKGGAIGLGRPGADHGVKAAARAQCSACGQQHIEHHADAGDRLARESAARLVRVDDAVRVGQLHHAADQRRQVVVGDEHIEAARTRMRHTVEAGNAVVHGDEQLRFLCERQIDDRRRQAVAVHGAVGHDIRQRARRRAEHRQAAHADGAGRGAVTVVVGDDADAALLFDRVGEQRCGGVGAFHRRRRQQVCQAVVEFFVRLHTSRCEQPRQQRMHPGLFECEGRARRHVAGFDPG